MKRLFSPLFLTLALFAGTGVAFGAINTASRGVANIVLEASGRTLVVTSLGKLGFEGKGPANSKAAASAAFTPVDVSFSAQPGSEGLARALAYISGETTSLEASLKLLDHNFDVRQVIDLGAARIMELQLPAANVTAKKPPMFRMRLQPQRLSLAVGSGKLASVASKSKQITEANFRVTFDGVAAPEIEQVLPSVVRRVGNELQISGLALKLAEAALVSGAWPKRLAESLATPREGAREKGSDMTLKIEYLDPALTKVFMSVEFSGVGIEALEIEGISLDNTENTPDATVRLYARDVVIK